MEAIRAVFRAELRRRWRSWLAIAILTSLVGGLALGAAAAGRCTESAFPSFVAAHGFDAAVFSARETPQIAHLRDVTSVTELISPGNGQPTCHCTHPINPSDLTVAVLSSKGTPPWKLVSGHVPDRSAPDQVLASLSLQQQDGVHIGTVIRVPFYAPSQFAAYVNATGTPPTPKGPTVALHVVGIEASEDEFASGGTPYYDLYASQGFGRTFLTRTATSYEYFVRLRHGAADIPRFAAAVTAMNKAGILGYQSEDSIASNVEGSIHPQAVGWWILAGLAALVGLALIGQALARQSITEREDYPTLSALGADQRQLIALGVARNIVVALVGAVGAVLLATALSPLAPVGEARIAEISTGVKFDTLVLPLGALITVVVVIALGIWPAIRAARDLKVDDNVVASHPSVLAARLALMGASPSALIGVRHALQRGYGKSTVPVRTALFGMVLAVVALCGTAVFGASLTHLTSTPTLYGDASQLNFTDPNPTPDPTVVKSLEHDRAVTGITEGFVTEVTINKVSVTGMAATAIRGTTLLSTVNGHYPTGDAEIGLGGKTMREVGAHLGSTVEVGLPLPSGGRRTLPFRVVAQISFPTLGHVVGLGNGAAFTIAGYEASVCPQGPKQSACRAVALGVGGGGLLVSVVPGQPGQKAIDHYLRAYESIAALPSTPSSLVNFGEAVNFPLIFGAMLALFGAATLVHLLVLSVSRRRREVGLLKALGFVNRQVASAVAWQSTTMALFGLVVGVPLGVVAGRAIWNAFANNLGVVPVAVVPIWLVVGLVASVIAVANLLSIAPALSAARTKPEDLRRAQ